GGRVKVADLGLVRVGTAAPLTLPGAFLGTPAFMAGQQVRRPHGVGPAADLYGLGRTVLYLAGGDLREDGLGRLSPELRHVLKRATARWALWRYPSARRLGEALAALAEGLPERGPGPTAAGPGGASDGFRLRRAGARAGRT